MLKQILFGVALCCLPAMADSIAFGGYSNWTNIGLTNANGVDQLTYSKTDDSTGVPIASVGTDVTVTPLPGSYNISGSIYARQGYGTVSNDPQTSANLSITLDLPGGYANWTLSGTDQADTRDTGYRNTSSCIITVYGGTLDGPCSPSSTIYNVISHDSGSPVTLIIGFGNYVDGYNTAYSESFDLNLKAQSVVLPPATVPEPASLALIGLPLFAFCFTAMLKKVSRKSTLRF